MRKSALVRLVVARVARGIIDQPAGMRVHRRDGIADHGERAIAEQIDLDQPRVLRAVLLELDDRHA